MLRRAVSSSSCAAAATRLLCSNQLGAASTARRVLFAATSQRYQSGGWVAPGRRGQHHQRKQQTNHLQRRPLVNGQAIPFHYNDLKQAGVSTKSSSSSDTLSLFGNNNTASSSSSIFAPQWQQQQPQPYYDSDLIVVLDMDECLLHSQFLQNPQEAAVYAHQLKQQQQHINYNNNDNNNGYESAAAAAVDSFRISLPDGELVHVHLRPGLWDFLRHVTSRYETHIFTAAMEVYAKPVLDHLCSAVRSSRGGGLHEDLPERPVFAGRWYREHCTWDAERGAYLKDLSKLAFLKQQQLHKKTVLVDNNPVSFHANPENGILVNSFYQDPRDDTLAAVTQVLADLEDCPDVRPVLAERFRLAAALDCPEQQHQATVVQLAGGGGAAAIGAPQDEPPQVLQETNKPWHHKFSKTKCPSNNKSLAMRNSKLLRKHAHATYYTPFSHPFSVGPLFCDDSLENTFALF